ncbi:MAG: sigma-54-dependent Fis family transcriptional regulator [Muribaculaceae bacterium]|nr:sigma-54-dependent Fis family transcriptional regulator [Muribaculaceae bacterium]
MADTATILQAKQRFGIIGNAPSLTAAIERAIRVAPIDLSVLVTGESGSGKEFFPQIIHAFSARKHAKYIAVNCGAIPEGTIDSELFGHEKGAFTGAVDSRKGYFEEANGGTIFLDEVAELPLTTQARLLRVLESGEFIKVGSSSVQKTNIRIVAATNVDLMKAVADGKFREDLYYRLSTVQIHIPPLRDRGNDIRLLARKFAADFAERYRVPAIIFSDEAEDAIKHYRWPGNVRQLKNVIDQIALFEAGNTVNDNILRTYLPDITVSYLPATGASIHSYEREREMLLSMIFKLQQRIDRMQERFEASGHAEPAGRIFDAAPAIIAGENVEPPFPTTLVVRNNDVVAPSAEAPLYSDVNYSEVIDSPASLEENERNMIRRALERHEGRRKAAAAELKISERTLYRKIKEYGLE